MIIKSSRIPVSDTANIAAYFAAEGENEEISWLQGTQAEIQLMGITAKLAGRAFSVRHVIVAPGEKLSGNELGQILDNVCQEYGVTENMRERITAVVHKKPRENDAGFEYHYHFAIPEVDTETGRVLDSKFTHMRNEKLSRLAELQTGHEITPGRFNREVYDALSRERPDLDLSRYQAALEDAAEASGMERADWKSYRAESSYTSTGHQVIKRKAKAAGVESDLSLPKIKSLMRSWASQRTPEQFIEHVLASGYELRPGKKSGIWRLYGHGHDLGSLVRLSGIKRHKIKEIMEQKYDNTNATKEAKAKSGPKSTAAEPAGIRDAGVGQGRSEVPGSSTGSGRPNGSGRQQNDRATGGDLRQHGDHHRSKPPSIERSRSIKRRFNRLKGGHAVNRILGSYSGGSSFVMAPLDPSAFDVLAQWASQYRAGHSRD
ncbi:hypothetical protein AB9K35_11635 [Leisingera sp. XS_AS12]|uniref:hypothetical protein n=1 Tax=Leisingera sp. XS_AS12 TaxID=3241294 RepID=UPI003517E73D